VIPPRARSAHVKDDRDFCFGRRVIPAKDITFRQFVALMAALMSTSALAMDIMLPALATIGQDLHNLRPNGQQLILTAYIVGGGAATVFFGPLSDHFGRKPMMLVGLSIYAVFATVCGLTSSFETMIAVRFLQGMGSAAPRVLVSSIVRDRHAGRDMARVMSLTMMILLAVPILAPSLGQLMLFVMPWRGLFRALAVYSAVIMIWAYRALPETLHARDRIPISFASVAAAARRVVTCRITICYMFAQAFTMGSVVGLVTSAQQIFIDVFHLGVLFPVVFAAIAGAMATSSFVNSRIVVSVGMRKVSHGALLAYFTIALIHAAVSHVFGETLPVFFVCEAATLFCVGLMNANFNAMALEPMGHIAGTASSVQAFIGTVGSGLIGLAMGQNFNGTANAIIGGNLICGLAILAFVLLAEGRLFRATVRSATPTGSSF